MSPSLPLVAGITAVIALSSLLFTGCAGSRYESPLYTVITSDGAFQIRDYPRLTLASTPMQRRGADGSFMKLFRFIQGGNDKSEKIPMTTPVIMTGTESGSMSFILPDSVARHGAPIPSNPDVKISPLPPTRYACYRFGGRGNPEQGTAASKKLLAWVASRHLTPIGTPLFAYYNPPWTPGFLRRNEVLLQLAPGRDNP